MNLSYGFQTISKNLNENKSEIVFFGPKENVFYFDLGSSLSIIHSVPWTWAVSLKFDKQISAVIKFCFYQLHLLIKVKPFLSRKNLETAIHAFVTSRLDYCNSLHIGISQSSISQFLCSKSLTCFMLPLGIQTPDL